MGSSLGKKDFWEKNARVWACLRSFCVYTLAFLCYFRGLVQDFLLPKLLLFSFLFVYRNVTLEEFVEKKGFGLQVKFLLAAHGCKGMLSEPTIYFGVSGCGKSSPKQRFAEVIVIASHLCGGSYSFEYDVVV